MTGTPQPSFSFVHAADLHLDTPFRGVQAVAPHVAEALRDASLDAFDAIVDLTLERGAAFLLVAGDVYDGADRGLRAQLRFRAGLQRLSDAGIATFVVHGNHDPVETGWSAVGSWPEGVTVFGSHEVTVVPVRLGGVQVATVQGISFATRATTDNLALGYARPATSGVHIGLLHCNVEGSPPAYAPYSPCTVADLRATGLDYFALGHVHDRSIVARGSGPGDPWIVYSGNSQARSPRSTETGAKGAYIVTVRDGHIEEPEFVPCDRIRFAELTPTIDGVDDLAELERLLEDHASASLADAEGRSVILRVRLRGRGDLHDDLNRPQVAAELLTHLRDAAPRSEPFWWWDSLADETLSALDIAGIRERGDFVSDLLAFTDDVFADPTACDGLIAELGDAIPTTLRKELDRLLADPSQRDALLESARLRALDELTRRA